MEDEDHVIMHAAITTIAASKEDCGFETASKPLKTELIRRYERASFSLVAAELMLSHIRFR